MDIKEHGSKIFKQMVLLFFMIVIFNLSGIQFTLYSIMRVTCCVKWNMPRTFHFFPLREFGTTASFRTWLLYWLL